MATLTGNPGRPVEDLIIEARAAGEAAALAGNDFINPHPAGLEANAWAKGYQSGLAKMPRAGTADGLSRDVRECAADPRSVTYSGPMPEGTTHWEPPPNHRVATAGMPVMRNREVNVYVRTPDGSAIAGRLVEVAGVGQIMTGADGIARFHQGCVDEAGSNIIRVVVQHAPSEHVRYQCPGTGAVLDLLPGDTVLTVQAAVGGRTPVNVWIAPIRPRVNTSTGVIEVNSEAAAELVKRFAVEAVKPAAVAPLPDQPVKPPNSLNDRYSVERFAIEMWPTAFEEVRRRTGNTIPAYGMAEDAANLAVRCAIELEKQLTANGVRG